LHEARPEDDILETLQINEDMKNERR